MKQLSRKKETWLSVIAIAAVYIIVSVLEIFIPSTSILFTVLKKGAIYALVAVSMSHRHGSHG